MLTLDRIYASPSLSGPQPRQLKLSPDGSLLTSLRPRDDDRQRYDLWAMDTQSGHWRMLLDSRKFGSDGPLSEDEKMQRERARISGIKGIVSYDWSPDGKTILVPLDGDLFLADLAGNVTRLTNTKTSELNATVSPKGAYVSFVRDQNVVILNRASQSEYQLTNDGKDTLSWGVAEFVAQEEMDRTQGLWWSPDDRRIAVARVDESGVDVVSRAAIGAQGTQVYDQRYPAAGTPNAVVDLFLIDADGGNKVQADLGDNPDMYLARVNWMPGGKTVLVQRQSRDQKTLDVLQVDAQSGASVILFQERADTWLNLHNNLTPLSDDALLWTSERDGFSHIYHFENGDWTQLTKGPWVVGDILGVNHASNTVYFSGNKSGPTEQHIYAVSLDGGAMTPLTDNGWWHSGAMNIDATLAIISRANPDQPTQVYLADTAGNRISWIEENRLDDSHPYAPFLDSHVPTEFGTITASDGTILHTKMLTPAIEPGKTYPVFLEVYGGPGVPPDVRKDGGSLLHQYMVDQGWIVFRVAGRGGNMRGKAFEDHIYRKMGGVEVADQLAGVEWLKQQDFVDPEKIAVFGWSYGGYMTLNLLEAAPGVFAAGVAGAPVTKWELYDTHYTERYMGTPQADAAAYAQSGVIEDSVNIVDPLLLIHGMADDNVIFENSTALMAKMQEAAVPFETMLYPGQTHSVQGPKVSVHLRESVMRFLDRNVKHKGAAGQAD